MIKLSEEQISKTISLLKAAATLQTIAQATGLNPTIINAIAKNHCIEKPWIIRKQLREAQTNLKKEVKVLKNAERDEKLIEFAKSMKSNRAIAEEFGVSSERVRTILKNCNVPSPKDLRAQRKQEVMKENFKTGEVLKQWVLSHKGCTAVELSLGTGISQSDCSEHLPSEMRHLVLNPSPKAPAKLRVKSKWTDTQVLDGIRKAAANCSPLSHVNYERIREEQEIDGPSAVRILQRFHTWKNACEQAGVQHGRTVRSNYVRNWTSDEMVKWLSVFIQKSPTVSIDSYNEWSRHQQEAPGGQTIRNTVGSWAECRQLALLELRKEWA